MEEIRGLEWSIALTTNAAKAYRGKTGTMRELGEKIAEFTKFFRRLTRISGTSTRSSTRCLKKSSSMTRFLSSSAPSSAASFRDGRQGAGLAVTWTASISSADRLSAPLSTSTAGHPMPPLAGLPAVSLRGTQKRLYDDRDGH